MSREAVVELIRGTTIRAGLRVRANLDKRKYEVGKGVASDALRAARLERKKFRGDWKYAVRTENRDR